MDQTPKGPTGPRRAPDKILDATPEPTVLVQRRFDSPLRRQTNPGGVMVTRLPPVPDLPLEVAATKPAPAPRQDAPTLRATAPTRQEDVRIVEPATGQPEGTLPPPSQDRADGELAALRRENDRLRALQSLPPDRGAWAKLGYRLAAAAVGAAILVITALGARMASKVGKVEDKNVALTKKSKRDAEQLRTRDQLWNDWGDRLVEVLRCNQQKQAALNKRQFPETQRAEPGPWPVYKDSCGELPERPRELPVPPTDVTEPP